MDVLFGIDSHIPFKKALPIGLQHVLVMFVANITPIIILAGILDFSPEFKANLVQNAMLCAVIIGGIVEGLIGLFAKYWVRFITPVVAATIVTAIGFSLLPILNPEFHLQFNLGAVLSFIVIFLVSATETIGDTTVLVTSGMNREPKSKELYRNAFSEDAQL